MRNAGVERAILGGAIASKKTISKATLAKLKYRRALVESALSEVFGFKSAYSSDKKLVEKIETMEKKFLGDFEQTRTQVYAGALVSGEYPMTPPEWITQSTEAINNHTCSF